jgi:hypothetical protein
MGLVLADSSGAQMFDACESIGPSPASQFNKGMALSLVGGHHDLASDLMGNLMLGAELKQLGAPLGAQSGFEGAGPIVEA